MAYGTRFYLVKNLATRPKQFVARKPVLERRYSRKGNFTRNTLKFARERCKWTREFTAVDFTETTNREWTYTVEVSHICRKYSLQCRADLTEKYMRYHMGE